MGDLVVNGLPAISAQVEAGVFFIKRISCPGREFLIMVQTCVMEDLLLPYPGLYMKVNLLVLFVQQDDRTAAAAHRDTTEYTVLWQSGYGMTDGFGSDGPELIRIKTPLRTGVCGFPIRPDISGKCGGFFQYDPVGLCVADQHFYTGSADIHTGNAFFFNRV